MTFVKYNYQSGGECMNSGIIHELQDMSYLRWSHIRSSSGTAGTFLKSESTLQGAKLYYKISNFDPMRGIIGHECVNELIVDRLLTILGVDHLHYQLIHAQIEIEGKDYETYLCASEDFKKRNESKIALDDYFRMNAEHGESHYDFCIRNNWQSYVDQMIAVDYLILNRDRHGANVEVLRNARAHSLRIAPLFDHGLSLLYSCRSDKESAAFDILADKPCNNFIGGYSCQDNLSYLKGKGDVFPNRLQESDQEKLFEGLEDVLSETFRKQIWKMIYERYKIYEDIQNL